MFLTSIKITEGPVLFFRYCVICNAIANLSFLIAIPHLLTNKYFWEFKKNALN